MSDFGCEERVADDNFDRFWEEISKQGSKVPELVSKDVCRPIFRAGWFAGGSHTADRLGLELALRHPAMRRPSA